MIRRAFSGSLREYRQWRGYLRRRYGKVRDWCSAGGGIESVIVHRRVSAVASVPVSRLAVACAA